MAIEHPFLRQKGPKLRRWCTFERSSAKKRIIFCTKMQIKISSFKKLCYMVLRQRVQLQIKCLKVSLNQFISSSEIVVTVSKYRVSRKTCSKCSRLIPAFGVWIIYVTVEIYTVTNFGVKLSQSILIMLYYKYIYIKKIDFLKKFNRTVPLRQGVI